MPKLTNTQLVLLDAAAAREDLSLLPLPETLRLRGAALDRTLQALIRRGLVAEAMIGKGASKWGSGRLVVTPAGLAAIGIVAAEDSTARDGAAAMATAPARPAAPSRPRGKPGLLLAAVSRPEGATLAELSAATGWLPHTTRAALTRLRRQGHDVRLASVGSRRAYHLVPAD
jgi:DNA-binding MarR family transcriptional regulator